MNNIIEEAKFESSKFDIVLQNARRSSRIFENKQYPIDYSH